MKRALAASSFSRWDSILFHMRQTAFGLREEWRSISDILASLLLMPVFVFIFANLWQQFLPAFGNFSFKDRLVYVALTETLVMTLMSYRLTDEARQQFSLSFARPRSWSMSVLSLSWGRTLGKRFVILTTALICAVVLIDRTGDVAGAYSRLRIFGRFALLVPIVTAIDSLIILNLTNIMIMWDQSRYFRLPILKLFLFLGGVATPLCFAAEPWRTWLTRLPFSDLVFQPAWFAMHGEFWQLSRSEWLAHIAAQGGILVIFSYVLGRLARHYHQSTGG